MRSFDKRQTDSFVVADIPGLIEGAHEGKGLGHEFLRHVSRAEMLIHLIDPTRENVVEDYKIINHELEAYDPRLATKEQLVVINKIDAVDPETIKTMIKALEKADKNLKKKIFTISAVTGENLKDLVFEMLKRVQSFRQNQANLRSQEPSADETIKIFQPHLEKKKFEVSFKRSKLESESGRTRKIFDVTGDRIEQVIKMTDIENQEGLERIFHFMSKMGIKSSLQRQGAKAGDRIRIAGKTFKMR